MQVDAVLMLPESPIDSRAFGGGIDTALANARRWRVW